MDLTPQRSPINHRMRSLLSYLTGLLFLPVFVCCHQDAQKPHHLTPAFYYWQTTYSLNQPETALLQRLASKKLYLRFFDVDWDVGQRQAVPKAVIRFKAKPTVPVIVPVVFITNRTLQHIQAGDIATLGSRIVQKIQQIAREQGMHPAEIQLDCDWTGSTRERYFALLHTIRKAINVPLSATIRLHQIKYVSQTGVPPVDRGMLMFYNMGDWKRPDTRNSIYDLDVAQRYTSYIDQYPLPLDFVMPLFRWTVVYRNNRFLTLLNNVDQRRLMGQSFLQMENDSNRFVAQHDTTAWGLSIRQGDLFRAEACTPLNLLRGKAELVSKIQNEKSTFALYHLDSTLLTFYNDAFLKTLLQSTP